MVERLPAVDVEPEQIAGGYNVFLLRALPHPWQNTEVTPPLTHSVEQITSGQELTHPITTAAELVQAKLSHPIGQERKPTPMSDGAQDAPARLQASALL